MIKHYCYECRYDVRGEDGIMKDCSHPNRQAAAHCCACASYNGERPCFESKQAEKENAMDRSNEMLSGFDALNAFDKCLNCKNLMSCEQNNWAITCDKDGTSCDNFEPLPGQPKEALKP